MDLIDIEIERHENPLDTVEQLAALNHWSFERSGDDEISISVEGGWSDYNLSLSWMEELDALHLACAYEIKVPPARRAEVIQLLALVNEQLWMGHFDLWAQEGVVMYRQSLPLPDGAALSSAQCAMMIEAAVEAAERYYQAFQFVVWAGKAAAEALEQSLFETAGTA
jgi:hypothetical protein